MTPRKSAAMNLDFLDDPWWQAPLLGLDVLLGDITDTIVLRISGKGDRKGFANHQDTGAAVFGYLPDVIAAMKYPPAILDPGEDALRRKWGVKEIRDRDCHVAATTNQLVGYAFVCGTTLFIYALDSATKIRIRPRGEAVGFNPFTEFVCRALYAYWPDNLRFAFWSRQLRLAVHGDRIQYVASSMPNLTTWDGDQIHDFHASGADMNTAVKNGMAVGDNTERRISLFVAKLQRLAKNCHPYSRYGLPLTHRVRLVDHPDGTVTLDTNSPPEPIPGMGNALESLVMAATDLRDTGPEWASSWEDIGNLAADLGLALPLPHEGMTTFADLQVGHRGVSARNLFTPERLSLWQTGQSHQRINGIIPGRKSYRGWEPTFDGPVDRLGHFDFVLRWGLPLMFDGTEGVPVPPERWSLLEQRLRCDDTGTADGRRTKVASSDDQALLAGVETWEEDGHEYDVLARTDAYVLRRRPLEEAFGPTGKYRAFGPRDGARVLSVPKTDVDDWVASTLERALEEIGDRAAPLVVRSPTQADRPDPRTKIQADIEMLKANKQDLETEATGANTMSNVLAAKGDESGALNKYEEAEQLRAQAAAVGDQILRANEELAILSTCASETEEFADLSRLAVVAGAARRYVGQLAPYPVATAIKSLFDGSFRMWPGPRTRQATLAAELKIPLISGEEGRYSLQGVIASSQRRHRDPIERDGFQQCQRDEVAREFLRNGVDRRKLADDHGWTITRLEREVVLWLVDKKLSMPMAKALVDSRIPEPKLAVWATVVPEDIDLCAEINPVCRTHLQSVYFFGESWSGGWCSHDHSLEHRISAILRQEAEPDYGLRVEPLAEMLGVRPTTITALAQHDSLARVMLRPPVFSRPAPGRIGLLSCLHSDCPGPAGARWLDRHIWTPETAPWGVLCPWCHRPPSLDHADLVMPDSYVGQAFCGAYGARQGRTHAKAHKGTSVHSWSEFEPTIPVPDEARWMTPVEVEVRHNIGARKAKALAESGNIRGIRQGHNGPGGGWLLDPTSVAELSPEYLESYRIRTQHWAPSATASSASDVMLGSVHAAKRLGISVRILDQLADKGLIPCERPDGQDRRFREADIDLIANELVEPYRDTIGTAAAAEILGLTKPQVRRRADKGQIPSVRTPLGTRRFRETELKTLVESSGD